MHRATLSPASGSIVLGKKDTSEIKNASLTTQPIRIRKMHSLRLCPASVRRKLSSSLYMREPWRKERKKKSLEALYPNWDIQHCNNFSWAEIFFLGKALVYGFFSKLIVSDGRHKNAVYDQVEKAKRRNVAEGAQVYRRSYNMPLAHWAMSLR